MGITELQHFKTSLKLRAEKYKAMDTSAGDRLEVETLRVIDQVNYVLAAHSQVDHEMKILNQLLTNQ